MRLFRSLKSSAKSKDFQILKFILIFYFGWWIIINFIAFFGLSVLPFHPSPNDLAWGNSTTDYWIRWANWDGGHFRGIAERGYLDFQVVFFPLYPLLIKALMFLGIPSLWGGLIISNLSILAALFFFYKLILLDYDEHIAEKGILFTLAFPTAFYFGTVYSESLFLFLAVASFYYARKKYWLYSLILAGFASATRLMGLAVIIAIGLEYFLNTSKPPALKEFFSSFMGRYSSLIILVITTLIIFERFLSGNFLYLYLGIFKSVLNILIYVVLFLFLLFTCKFIIKFFIYQKIFTKQTLFFLLSLLPFFSYCIFLYFTQGSFLAFVNHEQNWNRHLDFPWNAPLYYFKRLLSVGFFQIGSPAHTLLEFLFFLFFFVFLIFSYLKLRISYTLFFAASLFIPSASGTLIAIHRYGLIIFPVFILLATIKNREISNLWLYFSLMLQGILLVLFFNSYWVS